MTIRVGVIGLGFGKQHLREYHRLQDVEVAAVCDLNEDVLNNPLVLECGARTYRDAEKMFSREQLDAVSICTPPRTHKPLTVLAAQRGAHVLCEKPMAASLEDCDAMIQACEEHGVKLMIGFKKRFAPAYVELERLIQSELGLPFSIFFRYVCYGGVGKEWFWQDGGPIVENTAHAADILRFLAGDVQRVYAEGDNFLAEGRDEIDTAVFTLRFFNGCVGAVRAGCWAKGPLKREHLVAYFKKATVEIEGPFDSPAHLRVWRDESNALEELHFENAGGIPKEIEHFVECIPKRSGGANGGEGGGGRQFRDNKQPRVTGEDGRATLAICLAVKESALTNQPVVL